MGCCLLRKSLVVGFECRCKDLDFGEECGFCGFRSS